ncbi:cobalt-precorrin-6A reductase [Haloimpatiens sp. FM7315]|uniref:cobalt-precorrin-6A reductase n=1 Tax=Haloimpatiens sp. FM7315 TaxID=3298609 RepID=UPI00370B58F4
MIGLILGTSEGKKIVSLLNKYTEDLFISTATAYGGELLENYKYKILNTSPLDLNAMVEVINENKIKVFVDASHPYAVEVTKNAMKACKVCGIEYLRYERPSAIEKYRSYEKLIEVEDYEDIYAHLKNVKGNILNTTGSRNLAKILDLGLDNRIIQRVLPSTKVIKECYDLGISLQDIVAIKGPISYDLNLSFLKEYKAVAILMKDSGVEGGTEEKIKAAMELSIYAIVIKRKTIDYKNVFYNVEDLVSYIKNLVH